MDISINQNSQNESPENKKANFKLKLINMGQFKSRVLEFYLGQVKENLREIDTNESFTDEQKNELRKKLSEVCNFVPISIREVNAEIFSDCEKQPEDKEAETPKEVPAVAMVAKKIESVVEPNSLFGY